MIILNVRIKASDPLDIRAFFPLFVVLSGPIGFACFQRTAKHVYQRLWRVYYSTKNSASFLYTFSSVNYLGYASKLRAEF